MEALGVLGFVSTAVSIVTNQLPELNRRIKDYQACETKLLLYRDNLDTSFQLLNNWDQDWGHDFDRSYDVYREIWGRRNLDGIQGSLNTIQRYAEQVYTSMQTKGGLKRAVSFRNTPRNVARWLGLSRPPSREKYEIRDLRIIEKIGFSLFCADALDNEVNLIRSAVEDLYKKAEYALRDRGYAGQAAQISADHVETYKSMVRLSRFADALYDRLRPGSSRYLWAMNLRWPDTRDQGARDRDPHFKDLANDMRMDFSTYFPARRKADGSWYDAVVHLTIEQDEHSTGETRKLGNLSSSDFAWIEEEFQILFEGRYYRVARQRRPIGRRHSIRDQLDRNIPLATKVGNERRIGYLVDASRMLVIVTLWFIVLLKTKWFAHLCGCRVHCMPLGNSAPMLRFRGPHQNRHYVYQPCIVQETRHCHHQTIPESRRLQLLAVLYVEILLGERLRLEKRDGVLYFQSVNGQEYTEQEIFDWIEKVAPRDIVKAVKYCLHSLDAGDYIYDDTVNVDGIERVVLMPLISFYSLIMPANVVLKD